MRPLGEFAFQFLDWCRRENHAILVSDHVIDELSSYYSKQRISILFQPFTVTILFVHLAGEELKEARGLSKTRKESHFADILHAIIARNHRAVIITRDKGFQSLADIVESHPPEELV